MRKPVKPLGPPAQRFRCMDCRAVFTFTARDSARMFVHAERTNFTHIGFNAVPNHKKRDAA